MFTYINERNVDQIQFKTCHYCFTYYCSRDCRLLDWSVHKTTRCYYGRLSSICKRILSKIGRNYRLRLQLSKIAKTAFISTGKRGFVWLDFKSAKEAQLFLEQPIVFDDDQKQQQQQQAFNESGFNSSRMNFSDAAAESDRQKLSDFLFYFGNNLLPKYVCYENENRVIEKMVKSSVFNKHDAYLDDDIDIGGGDCGNRGSSRPKPEKSEIILSKLFYYMITQKALGDGEGTDDEYEKFKEMCFNYDTFNEFILVLSIQTNNNEVPVDLYPRKINSFKRKYVLKFMKLSIIKEKVLKEKSVVGVEETMMQTTSTSTTTGGRSTSTSAPLDKSTSENEYSSASGTLILTSLSNPTFGRKTSEEEGEEESNDEAKRKKEEENRQLFLVNLLTEFQSRGIDLKIKFPKLYRDLLSYVDQNTHLSPVCLFPRDLTKNNLFMCLIVPNSEPATNAWLYESNEDIEKNLKLKDFLYIA